MPITIDEAIKVKEEYRREHYYGYNPRFVEADNLSIEALKRLQQLRTSPITWFRGPLPGETED